MQDYPFETIADEVFDLEPGHSSERMGFCPEHYNTRTPALSVNVDSGAYFCHGCGYKGSFKSGAGGYRIDKLQLLFAQIESVLSEEKTTADPYMVIDDKVLNRFADDSPENYWQSIRGLDRRTMDKFELGYDSFTNSAIIPNRDRHGDLVGISRRYLDEDAKPKHKHSAGFNKAQNLFGLHLYRPDFSDTLVLVEGQTDAMKVWQAGFYAVAIYGASISKVQVDLLRKSGATRFILAFDNYKQDPAGKASNRKCKGFLDEGYDKEYDLRVDSFGVYDAPWREGHPKDLGAMDDRFIEGFLNRSYCYDLNIRYAD